MNNKKNNKNSNHKNNNTHILHLYSSNISKYAIQKPFLSSSTEKEKSLYITNDPEKQVLEKFKGLIKKVTVIDPKNLSKTKINGGKLRIVVDGGSINEDPLLFEKKLRKLGNSHSIMCTYPVAKIDSNLVRQLVVNHDNLVLTTEDKTILSSNELGESISDKTLEKFVKSNLEMIVLALIQRQPMCGTEIIKIIHKNFNVLLSPGAVYPLLHNLTKNGMLKCDYVVKKKIYKPTEDAEGKITGMINEQLQANKMFVQLLGQSEVR